MNIAQSAGSSQVTMCFVFAFVLIDAKNPHTIDQGTEDEGLTSV
jgi:hypothetical protein